MTRKILILDSSILCVLLDIPGKNDCTGSIKWTHKLEATEIAQREKDGWYFVLPIACVIEAGNHITHCNGDRFQLATQLVKMINSSLSRTTPWISFSESFNIWHTDNVQWLENWPKDAAAQLSIADRTISLIADNYSLKGDEVEIFTCDEQLKSYEPALPSRIPRRRKKET
jgi:hypothetical protein